MLVFSCRKTETLQDIEETNHLKGGKALPTLTTTSVAIYSTTDAYSGGDITSDGGARITAEGVCWSTSTNPTTANSHTHDSGDPFTSKITGLSASTTYYVRAYATTSSGTGYGNQVSFCTPSVLTDYDDNEYNVVVIGTQTWMQENLKVTHYKTGTAIPEVTDNSTWIGLTTGAWCYYDNDEDNIAYGLLYNWYTVNTGNLCPTNWHVPSDDEWKTLEMYLGMSLEQANAQNYRGNNEGGKLKETGTTHWSSPNTGATNTSLFTALGSGDRYSATGYFANLKYDASIWTSTNHSSPYAWFRELSFNEQTINRQNDYKKNGKSVRCVKD